MSDTNNPDNTGRRPLTIKPRSDTGTVKQSFSHGRSKQVSVEVKKKKVVLAPGATPKVARPAAAAPVAAPVEVEKKPAAAAPQPTAAQEAVQKSNFSEAELKARKIAIDAARADQERRKIEQEAIEEANRRRAEEARRMAEEEKRRAEAGALDQHLLGIARRHAADLDALHDELAELNVTVTGMKQRWEQEKQAIDAIRSLKEELEQLRTQVERETDLAAAAEIRYGRIPENDRRIADATVAEIEKSQLVMFSGGFSYGDYVMSGRLAQLVTESKLGDAIQNHHARGGFTFGICNGFQILTKLGILPTGSLIDNTSERFVCRWAKLQVKNTSSPYLQGLPAEFELPVAHAEGRFVTFPGDAETYLANGNVALTYADNFNGSTLAIAGLQDPTGRAFGLMPHPERFIQKNHHYDPDWNGDPDHGYGYYFFRSIWREISGGRKLLAADTPPLQPSSSPPVTALQPG